MGRTFRSIILIRFGSGGVRLLVGNTRPFVRTWLALVFIASVVGVSFAVGAVREPPPTRTTAIPHPFFFTENNGQWDSRVLYKCDARNGMTWFLERDGVTLLTMVQDKTKPPIIDPMDRDLPEMMRRHPPRYPMKSHALKFKFIQSPTPNPQPPSPPVRPEGELPWHNNYFLGNDSSKWAPDCRNFSTIIYRDVWEGIDVEWYEQNGKLEFDFVVQPGADASQIRMSCDGLEGELELAGIGNGEQGTGKKGSDSPTPSPQPLTPNSELRLLTSLGELRTVLPSVYQITSGGFRSEVDAQFEIISRSADGLKNEFGVMLPNGYQKEHTLRIDPLIYSTFLGGSGIEIAFAAVSDSSGGVILTGYTQSSNFPTTVGAYDGTFNGNLDCFVAHVNQDGSQLLYSTFLGGVGNETGYAITNDGVSGIIVTGGTGSGNFPTTNGAYQSTYQGGTAQGGDCFITRLNNTGSQLIYSTYLGGSSPDEAYGIVGNGNGGAIVTGYTLSTNFPTTTGAYDTSFNGGRSMGDCFITHINNTGSQLTYSTFLGGSSDDNGRAIINGDGSGVIVIGVTTSPNFPTTANTLDTSYNGSFDCFVTRLDSTGSHLIYSTFLGGAGSEGGYQIVNDGDGGCIISGVTNSTNFPTTVTAFDTSFNGGLFDCFITRLNSTGSRLVYSTYLGGSGEDRGYSLINDGNGGVIVTGITASTDFPTTVGAFCNTYNGGTYDCFVSYMNNTGSQLLYSTYIGGYGQDAGYGIVRDRNGGVIVVGQTYSPNFPITTGAFDTTYNGGSYDCFVTRLQLAPESVSSHNDEFPFIYSLNQNYPNPFNSTTIISYSLPKYSEIKLELFDLLGRSVSTLVNTKQNAGTYRVRFDGEKLASGEYFYRLTSGSVSETRKMILIK